MKFKIDELDVYFPYPTVYKEQLEYMKELKKILDNHGHGIIEMPTGTGKTVSLLALITSYLESNQDKFKKLIYCTRTVVEMEKTIEEVKFILDNRKQEKPEEQFKFLCTGLSARSNLCIHPNVSRQQSRDRVDAECKKLTAPWVRAQSFEKSSRGDSDQLELCQLFENFEGKKEELKFTEGIYNLEDLRQYGEKNNICPYFLARRLLNQSNIIVYNYMYMLDAKMTEILDKEFWKDCLVVFDEAHNIDNVCLEVFTVDINRKLLDMAYKNIEVLGTKVDRVETINHEKLESEYNQLLQGLKNKGVLNDNQLNENSKQLPSELTAESIPFHIKKAKPFIQFLKKIVIFLKNRLKEKNATTQDPPQFINDMYISSHLDSYSLKLAGERLNMLLNSLEITETDEFSAIDTITHFTSLLASYARGFKIIYQPNPKDGSLNDPLMTFACLDCSLAMTHVFTQFKSVILTSGTMSPLDIYPKILNFNPYTVKSIDIELTRNSIQPLIATKGIDFTQLSSEYEARANMTVTRSYGSLLIDLSKFVPDGIVAFFPSYMYMEKIIYEWNQEGILDEMRKYKLLYFESKDVAQTSQSLFHYRKACDCGRGAIFFSIARGKIAEGIDFNEHYGRAVVMVGFPVQNSKDPILIERCKYLTENFKITKNEYIEFDAMRQTAQCLGRVMRGKTDYGIMIMAEKRFARSLVKSKLPNWIKKQMPDCNVDISVDITSILTEQFFKKMGKAFELDRKSYFTQEQFEEIDKLNQDNKMEAEKLITGSSTKDQMEEEKDQKEKEALQELHKIKKNKQILEKEEQEPKVEKTKPAPKNKRTTKQSNNTSQPNNLKTQKKRKTK
ncbi:DNA repair helicase (macronuclear) [Tetrahymena thermophila SB210]|uniref:DNA 5'-3' helicase n=1 Tax=Tetrahymena thermophila (strain SB210) TaxID=312017 RepID=I7M2Q2_TETTS|nr:DNA repair helicase [Tetrahymena thermophila SB210]EAS01088.2 DNA repair helicase [Tetrahymena thermophila SB210]|eukprot:XP_001021333.2 DNA repair helicase [Tetrahymena thermophila SB210]